MITNVGTGILTKYLLGQTASYASHIAIGCGATPISTTPGDYSAKTSLDFEMIRLPILSRGHIIENNTQQIVFTAEMPSDGRYEISEVGIYPAAGNPSATTYDSKTLFTFDQNSSEKWLADSAEIPLITASLDSGDGSINATDAIFRANATNIVFENVNRLANFNNETPRFLDSAIFIEGNAADLPEPESGFSQQQSDAAVAAYTPVTADKFIKYSTTGVNLKKYGPNDKIKIAMSVINKSSSSGAPEHVAIQIRFKTATADAVLGKIISAGDSWNPSISRYLVIEEELQNIVQESGFVWDNVNAVEIYVAAFELTAPSANYYVVLDGVRIENVSSTSPVYGLVGYSVIKNTTAETVKKKANASTLVEFRFAVDVA